MSRPHTTGWRVAFRLALRHAAACQADCDGAQRARVDRSHASPKAV